MTQTFEAQVNNWTAKALDNTELVVRGSAQDVSELMTRRQEAMGKTVNGKRVQVRSDYTEGFVPVDTSELINSQVAAINSVRVAEGEYTNYAAVLAGFELGDEFLAGFTAKHARALEYGLPGKFGGRFFVRNAVQQWQTVVDQNAAQFRD